MEQIIKNKIRCKKCNDILRAPAYMIYSIVNAKKQQCRNIMTLKN